MFNKISSIIPQNSRTGGIDVSNERPVRAGAPSFGLPTVKSRSTLPVVANESIDSNFSVEPEEKVSFSEESTKLSGGQKLGPESFFEPQENSGRQLNISVYA